MTVIGRPGPVVVGVDYSNASAAAVSQAAWEAKRRGVGLRLVHGFVATDPGETPPGSPDDQNELIIAAGQRLAEAATVQVRSSFPELAVSTKVVAGSGGMTLVNESSRAGLVVVGARGSGG